MGKYQHLVSAAAFLGSLALLASCSTSIAYKPIGGTAPAPAQTLVLQVVDQRPADQGGSERNVVGKVRGSYGIPASVTDANANVVLDTVSQATADALAQSGVGVGTGNRTLVGTVKHYWMDGFQGYKGTITVAYELRDASGNVLWSKELSGGSGGALIFKSGVSMTQDIFAAALTELAKKAATEFKSEEFQKALG
jgi:hypothetical protein